MTQMEYIRSIAPDGYMETFDEETLKDLFADQWKEYCERQLTLEEPVNPINDKLDYMVLTLVREFGDKLAFKGGYMLSKLIPKVAHQSTDIDFSIDYDTLYYDMISTIRAVGDHFIEEGYIERYVVKETIEPHRSGGADFYAVGGKKVLGIDVGWHPTDWGTMHTDIGITTVRHFTVERMLSDKVCAILTKKRFRRAKDIYDLHQLMRFYDVDLVLLRDGIRRHHEDTPVEWQNYPFNEIVIREYRKAYDKLVVESIHPDEDIVKPSFDAVCDSFAKLMTGIRTTKFVRWNHVTSDFELR